jgi:hypothetical protein
MTQSGYAAVLACSVAVCCSAGGNPAEVLNRITVKVVRREAALPNYTCVETVTRDYYDLKRPAATSCAALIANQPDPASGLPYQLTVTDRLRLDVTITPRGEIYSWVGASRFEENGVDRVVRDGPFGSGSFGAPLAIIFHQDAKTFRFTRYLLDQNRDLMEYSFEVSQENSRYRVKAGDTWVPAAYSGTVQVDPQTDEVVRLTLHTSELPPATNSCQTSQRMEFAPQRIGSGVFLLPSQAQQQFLSLAGDAVQNHVSLSNCREYVGESTVSFSEIPETDPDSRSNAPPPIQLPAGLAFTFELTTPISADTAAAGDPFAGRLVSALRDKSGKTVAPTHALMEGRLVRVEIRHRSPPGAVFVLQLTTVEAGGIKVPLAAIRQDGPVTGKRGGTPVQLPLSWEANSGIFGLSGDHAILKSGSRSSWRTAAAVK